MLNYWTIEVIVRFVITLCLDSLVRTIVSRYNPIDCKHKQEEIWHSTICLEQFGADLFVRLEYEHHFLVDSLDQTRIPLRMLKL